VDWVGSQYAFFLITATAKPHANAAATTPLCVCHSRNKHGILRYPTSLLFNLLQIITIIVKFSTLYITYPESKLETGQKHFLKRILADETS
jgi:hypothetical protein